MAARTHCRNWKGPFLMISPRDVVQMLKETAGGPEPRLVLMVPRVPRSMLKPVAVRGQYLEKWDVRALTDWRNRYVTSFLTEFRATEDRTANWLVNTVGPNPGKILFMVQDLNAEAFGYMGLDFIDWQHKSAEVDAVVRGRQTIRGAMSTALTALIDWARLGLDLPNISVRVRSDNPAIRFYTSIGFREERRVPLARHQEGDEVHWRPDQTRQLCSPHLVHLRYEPSDGEVPNQLL